MITLETPIQNLTPKLTPHFLARLQKMNILTVEDLLFHIPRAYVDYSSVIPISDLYNIPDKEPVTVQGTVIKKTRKFVPGRRLMIITATIEDESGQLTLNWYNQKWIFDTLKENTEISISGKVDHKKTTPTIANPILENIREDRSLTHTGKLLPIYPETTGLTSRFFRFKIGQILDNLPPQKLEFLPKAFLTKLDLPDMTDTLENVHRPPDIETADRAKFRLAFNEAFLTQTYILQQKIAFQSHQAPIINFYEKETRQLVDNLPFTLTDSQKKSAWEILLDMQKPTPMNRLLEGDVGSGKTLVAVLALLNTFLNGKQSTMMAPTEILASQHFENICRTIEQSQVKPFPSIALLTGSATLLLEDPSIGIQTNLTKKDLRQKISDKAVDIIIGTHSLITEKMSFGDLALAIIDEQHRFGVRQRAQIQQNLIQVKDSTIHTIPHLLSMTATPIPRTLALSIYGDLDVSLLTTMPKGRKKILTKVIPPSKRQDMYGFLRQKISEGEQVFVICPLIEPSEEIKAKSVTEVYEDLNQNVFADLKVAMLHGKMKPKDKEALMQDFKNHNYDILISTSVIEVGVDVPNATIMVIESAERFGLAQLHQFRGRVGRGEKQSYCFLFETDETQEETLNQRLLAIEKAKNGFELAEMDLKLRGPGQFIGSQQSGLPDISMLALTNKNLIQNARNTAKFVLEKDPTLASFPKIKAKVQMFREKIHFE
jgi:ATP-dependent DNA helicase RecG